MARDPQLLSRLARLSSEVAIDASALAARSTETEGLLRSWSNAKSISRPDLMLVAANLHGYYTALETLCERVARQLDDTVPTGASWHADLIAQMQVEVPGLRPRVVPTEVVGELHELRKFRHFFRNAYVLDFDPVLVRAHAERLVRVHRPVAATIGEFEAHMQRTIRALVQSD